MSEDWNENGRVDGIDTPVRIGSGETSFSMNDNAEGGAEKVPSKHDPQALEAHAVAGHEFIALRRWDAKDAKGKPVGKSPEMVDWRRRPAQPLADASKHMAKGNNIGVRLRETDFVIDVDPRNFLDGVNSYDRLASDFGLPEAPFVNTGGGGWHYYFKKPAGFVTKEAIEGYPGIEFKSIGRQVVAAGSIHPNGTRYSLDDDVLALSLGEAPKVPDALLDALKVPPTDAMTDSGAIDEERLADWLSFIDVAEFRAELKWRRLMMACHHATGGSGLHAFRDWSTTDPAYADHGEIISRRWKSLKRKTGEITIRTLIAALPKEKRQEATELLSRSAPEDDFPDEIEMQETEERREVWDNWVWVADAERFIRRSDTKKLAKEQWKSLFAGLKPDGDVLNAIWRGNVPMRKFETLVYRPEEGEFPDGERGGRYNLWRRSGVEARKGDVSTFLDHMAYLFPEV